MRKKSLYVFMSAVFIAFALFLVGCGSESGNITHGGGVNPIPTPEPTPQGTEVKISGICVYPDGVPIAGVVINNDTGLITDANGHFEATILVYDGQTIIPFARNNFVFDGILLTFDTGGKINTAYDDVLVTGFIPMSADNVKYRVSTPQIIPENKFSNILAISPNGRYLYTSSIFGEFMVYRIDINTMQAVVIAGSGIEGENTGVPGNEAKFYLPSGMTVSPDGTSLYLNDVTLSRVKKITNVDLAETSSDTMVYTIAGNGNSGYSDDCAGNLAEFKSMQGLTISLDGGTLYLCDYGNYCIRKITGVKDATSSTQTYVYTIAGQVGTTGHADDIGSQALFSGPLNAVMASDGTMYIADTSSLRKITGLDTAVTSDDVTVMTIAGSGAVGDNLSFPVQGNEAKFRFVFGLSLSQNENTIFVTDAENHKIKFIKGIKNITSASDTVVDLVAGTGNAGDMNGDGVTAEFYLPSNLQLIKNDSIIYVIDRNNFIRRIVATE